MASKYILLLPRTLGMVSLKTQAGGHITICVSPTMAATENVWLVEESWNCTETETSLWKVFLLLSGIQTCKQRNQYQNQVFPVYCSAYTIINAPYIIWSFMMRVALNSIYPYTVCVCRNTNVCQCCKQQVCLLILILGLQKIRLNIWC